MKSHAPAIAALSIVLSGCSLVDALSGESTDPNGISASPVCSAFACWQEEVIELAVPGNPSQVAVSFASSDDAIADIVFAQDDGRAFLMTGTGDGKLSQPTVLPGFGGEDIHEMVATDEAMFAAGTKPIIAFAGTVNVTVRFQNGMIFKIPVGDQPGPLAIGDFDGDGEPDVAVGHSNGEVSILLRADDFQPLPARVSNAEGLGNPVVSLAAGRFAPPGGCHDLVIAQQDGSATKMTQFFCDQSSGPMFEEQRSFGDVASPVAIRAGRFSEGELDEVALGTTCGATCEGYDVVRILNSQGQYQVSFAHGAVTDGPFALSDMIVGNFDNDGGDDIVMVGSGDSESPDIIIALGANSGGAGFPDIVDFPRNEEAIAVSSGDLNLDGRPDFAILHPQRRLRLLLSTAK